jgi:DNA-binding transcriptional LysR family regulator
VVRDDIVIRALSPAPPVRQVIAATPAGARLVPAAPAMLGVLGQAADELKQTGRPVG